MGLAGALCQAAHGFRGSQGLGQADFGTLGRHMLRQEAKRRHQQERLPEFYYLQKNTVMAAAASPPLEILILGQDQSWSLRLCPLSPECRGQESEGQASPGPLQTAGVGRAPAVPWHRAHSDVGSPFLGPQRDRSVLDTPAQGAAIPQHGYFCCSGGWGSASCGLLWAWWFWPAPCVPSAIHSDGIALLASST